jgi:hypothetical protein
MPCVPMGGHGGPWGSNPMAPPMAPYGPHGNGGPHNDMLRRRFRKGRLLASCGASSGRGQIGTPGTTTGTRSRPTVPVSVVVAHDAPTTEVAQARPRRRPRGPGHHRRAGTVCLRDHHPAYISWEEFMANQLKLKDNVPSRHPDQSGAPRKGHALLQELSTVDASPAIEPDRGRHGGGGGVASGSPLGQPSGFEWFCSAFLGLWSRGRNLSGAARSTG